MLTLRYVNKYNREICYAKEGDSGIDLRAYLDGKESVELKPLQRMLIHTGIYFDVPEGCEIQVRSKSGRALNNGLVVLNSPGTVDEGYTGECCVIVINLSNEPIKIFDNDKIAQAVVCPVFNSYDIRLKEVLEIEKESERGTNGFGHTGVK